MTALQYDSDDDGYYLLISDSEYGPFSESELEDLHNCLYAHFS